MSLVDRTTSRCIEYRGLHRVDPDYTKMLHTIAKKRTKVGMTYRKA